MKATETEILDTSINDWYSAALIFLSEVLLNVCMFILLRVWWWGCQDREDTHRPILHEKEKDNISEKPLSKLTVFNAKKVPIW